MSKRIIIDTDTAQDDCIALIVALLDPGARLEAITTSRGVRPNRSTGWTH